MAEGGSSKQKRLRPWLEGLLNRADVPGLRWINGERTMFRIPWKHRGKQDWSPDQSRIFMEWAKQTGRYREGVDPEDYPTWKTRLRCAFNKAPDIEEVVDLRSMDAADPYRVYRLKPAGSVTSRRLVTDADQVTQQLEYFQPVQQTTFQADEYNRHERTEAWLQQQTPGAFENASAADVKRMKIDRNPEEYSLVGITSGPFDLTTQPVNIAEPVWSFHDVKPQTCRLDLSTFNPQVETSSVPPHPPPAAAGGGGGGGCGRGDEFTVTVHYCGREVLTRTVKSESATAVLYYDPTLSMASTGNQLENILPPDFEQMLFGPSDAELIALPACDDHVTNARQKELVCDLLWKGLTRGLVINCRDNKIFVYRLCQCAVFYYGQSTVYVPGLTSPIKLQRVDGCSPPELTRIFDGRQYVAALKDFLDERGPMPDPRCVLVLGQQLTYRPPDSTVLITVTITTSRAIEDLKRAESAMALRTPDIHVSTSTEFDKLASCVRYIEINATTTSHQPQQQVEETMEVADVQYSPTVEMDAASKSVLVLTTPAVEGKLPVSI